MSIVKLMVLLLVMAVLDANTCRYIPLCVAANAKKKESVCASCSFSWNLSFKKKIIMYK